MEVAYEDKLRVLSLRQQMGDLWSEDDFTNLDFVTPAHGNLVSEFLLYGKLFLKPNVNFQAFLNTMRKAWKLEDVKCEVIELGFYVFLFNLDEERKRMMHNGPWSFASNFLVLNEGDPKIPKHCYDFQHCSFWVQLVGLPRATVVENSIEMVVGKIGQVEAIKIEARNNSARKIGKAQICLNLLSPLKTCTIIHLGGRKWWIDFKYERLPHFYYSCRHIGYYATACPKVSYEDSCLPQDKPECYGSWLKAKAKELIPYRHAFYGELATCPLSL